ncbi:MAG: prolyl-tRNA synthetase associated domain-containing protein [Rhodospirillaceae bacterium]|jgi:Ala-tRNA(Pro) deacylase|nr:prolyl-tRNA synthetase associated domain-containing protein [Rhodospirillaceae bacterium]MBT5459709.1 prolyl-tRNA synthetase associated domain-containing protein [Rhodospirillaceae bacterium]
MTDETPPSSPAAATPDALFARLDGLGIDYETHHHEPVFTVDEAKHLRGALPGAHCKSLFIRDKKKICFLVVCLEDRRLDMKALAGLLDCGRLSFGSADRLRQRLGVTPGSVTPFAAINDEAPEAPAGAVAKVQIVLDQEMMQAALVNYHPLINDMTTALSPDSLLRFLQSTGHEARIVDLAAASRED